MFQYDVQFANASAGGVLEFRPLTGRDRILVNRTDNLCIITSRVKPSRHRAGGREFVSAVLLSFRCYSRRVLDETAIAMISYLNRLARGQLSNAAYTE